MVAPYTATETDRASILDPLDLPELYAMELAGTCLEPMLKDGGKAMFSKTEPWKRGDIVIIWRHPEFVRLGDFQAITKRAVTSLGPYTLPYRPHPQSEVHPTLIVEMLNPPRLLALPLHTIMAVHKYVGVPASTYPCPPEHARRLAERQRRAVRKTSVPVQEIQL